MGTATPGETVEVSSTVNLGDMATVEWLDFVPDGPNSAHAAQLLSDIARIQRRDAAEGGPELMVVGWLARPYADGVISPTFARDIRLSVVTIPIDAETSR
jgi:hypothetical protein